MEVIMKIGKMLRVCCAIMVVAFLGGCVSAVVPPEAVRTSDVGAVGGVSQIPLSGGRFIAVAGNGKAEAEPDTAEFTVGVEQTADDALSAQDEANRIANALVEALKAKGVGPEDMRTSNVSLWTEEVRPEESMMSAYNPAAVETEAPSATMRVRYRASVNVQVTTKDIQGIGELLKAASEAGANQVYGLQFSLEDDSEMYQEAVSAALANAKTKAEFIAAQTGAALGDIVEVMEQSYSSPVMYREAPQMNGGVMTMADSAMLNVEAGRLDVTASVSVKYSIIG
jgi:uncharacterized protein YggE